MSHRQLKTGLWRFSVFFQYSRKASAPRKQYDEYFLGRLNFRWGGVICHRRRTNDHDACWSGWQQRCAVLLQEVNDSLDDSSERESQLKAADWVGNWRLRECYWTNQYVTLPEGELLSTYIHGLHQLSRYNIQQYSLEQLLTCCIFVSCNSCYGEAYGRFRTVALSLHARNLFYFIFCVYELGKQTMELLQTWTSEFTRQLPDKGSCGSPEKISLQKHSCKVLW